MVRSVLFLIIFALSFSAQSEVRVKSAKRDPGISYLAYKATASMFAEGDFANVETPTQVSKPYQQASQLRAVTEWQSIDVMNRHFQEFRDKRFLTTDAQPGFMRRSSWLYPDDGCFARAGLAIMNLAQAKVVPPEKIFVFGNLTVKTVNSPDGSVSWWYHVAPIVQVAGEKYVLDPALNPRAPLKLEDWLGLMGSDIHQLEVAICKSGSYTPDDTCDHVTDGVEDMAQSDQISYLNFEWSRVEDLHRNPKEELGDHPPWLPPAAVF